MQDYEKLGAFYLGREHDLNTGSVREDLVLYDSRDLVTHAVCVGMTGSGKTGLGIVILEEAAIDGIPAIVIDPKGDLANLLLTFPDLRGEDFEQWVNVEDAAQKGLSPKEFAAQQAGFWQKGLADWGQGGDRIRRLRDSADVVIYTPGSNAGVPVSILKSFAAPAPAVRDDQELLRERIGANVAGLLALLGIEADPLQSREHILLSTLIDWNWNQGRDLDLASLIQQIQSPPVSKIGVLDLDSFYPSRDRFGLVMALNGLLAAPGFETWMQGEALDIARILYGVSGKPRLAVFSIAHLNDSERMFFVSLLLNQVLGWMRAQSGTTSLRAVLYMDEIFGYFPPVANPPSKKPLLTLLKQARAFGLGIVVATQNPVDLDYKGLSNAGTWFVGRLQTDRDKQRLLDGLEGAAAGSGAGFDRQRMEQILGRLGSRIFLMNNTHEDAPVVFQTRWALSYLRGPLTRDQIRELMRPHETESPAVNASAPVQLPAAPPPKAAAGPPPLAPDVQQYFIPVRGSAPAGSRLLYQPMILGAAKINFSDAKSRVDVTRDALFATSVTGEAVPVQWQNAKPMELSQSDLETTPQASAQFADLPAPAAKGRNYAAWNKDFAGWIYGSQVLELYYSAGGRLFSNPGESEKDFRIRLQQGAREQRDDAVDQIRRKYASRVAALQDRIRRAQDAVERERAQAKQQQFQTAISFGTTLLGAVFGRKAVSASTLGKATTAARGVSRSMKERQDVGRAEETVESLQQQLSELNAELESAVADLQARVDPLREELETIRIKPRKTGISVQLLTLAWAPHWCDPQGFAKPAWR